MLCANFLLQLVQIVVYEFDDITALQTDQMIVPGPSKRFFEPGVVLAKPVFGDQAALDKQIEGIVHGSPRNPHTSRIQLRKEIVSVEVSSGVHNFIEEKKALPGRPELLLFQILNQDVFCS
jgi:hypothetical protein